MVSATCAFEGDEGLLLRLLLLLFVLLLLQLLFQLHHCWSIQGTVGDTAMLEGSTIETRAVIIVALSDHLPTADDDTSMAVVERRLGGLLEAKREILIRLHFCC